MLCMEMTQSTQKSGDAEKCSVFKVGVDLNSKTIMTVKLTKIYLENL